MADNATETATAPTAPAPATSPATTPPAQPAPPAPASAPAAPTAAPPPVEQQVGMTDTIEYVDSSGKTVETSVQELTEAKTKMDQLGDIDGLKDMVGFLKGDPGAQQRVLQAQMDQIAPPPVADPQAEYVKQLEERVATLDGRMAPMEKLVTQAAETEDGQYVAAMLAIPQVVTQFPTLAHKPDVALKLLQPQYTRLRQLAASKGVDLSTRNDLVIQMMQRAETELKGLLGSFGLEIPQAQAGESPQVNGQPAAPSAPVVPQVPGMLPQVPLAGGVMGTPAVGAQQQATGVDNTREGLLARLRANRIAQGAK